MDQQVVADMREEFDVRRQFMLGRLSAIKNVKVVVTPRSLLLPGQHRAHGHQQREFL